MLIFLLGLETLNERKRRTKKRTIE